MADDSDTLPLEGEPELSPAERLMLRRMIRDEERATWARRRLRVLVPAMVAVVTMVWHAVDWAIKHVRVTP
jgi:hypothetical protein